LLVTVLVFAACGGGGGNNNANSSGGTGASGGGTADSTKPVYGGSVVYAQEAEDAGGVCIPESQLDINGINYAQTIYDTLMIPNDTGKFVPFLAEKLEKSADLTTWTITVRDGIKFHDGTPLTATVVKNNIDAWRGAYPTRTPILLGLVFGPYIDSITADDAARTVTVKTKVAWRDFDAALWGQGRLGMMAQAQLDDKEGCAKNLIGTGPFKLKEWVVNDHFTADRNPDYWRKDADGNQLPYLDEITFKPVPDGQARLNGLQSGQFNLTHTSSSLDIEQIRALDQQGVVTNNESDKFGEVSHYMLNETKPPFDNLHARLAVAYAIDYKTVNKVRAHDIPTIANGPFAPGSVGYLADSGYPTFDLEKAKSEVAAYKADTGKDLEFTFGGTPDPENVQTTEFVKGELEQAGMKVSTYAVEQTQYINKAIARDFEMYGWRNFSGTGGDTLYFWWHCNNAPPAACDNLVNFGGFNDAQLNSDLDKGRSEPDVEKARALYEDVNRQFAKNAYNIWMSYTIWSVATSKNVHNIFGATLPNGDKPNPGLANGHAMSGIFVTK
jgi:peptide/nickel transport system substrate-binding protein